MGSLLILERLRWFDLQVRNDHFPDSSTFKKSYIFLKRTTAEIKCTSRPSPEPRQKNLLYML